MIKRLYIPRKNIRLQDPEGYNEKPLINIAAAMCHHAANANFAGNNPRTATGHLTTAGTLAGTNLVDIVTGTANGTRVEKVYIKATANTTAGQVRLFAYDGANARCLTEVIVTAINVAAGTQSFEQLVTLGIWLGSGQKLQANTNNAETFDVTAFIADF